MDGAPSLHSRERSFRKSRAPLSSILATTEKKNVQYELLRAVPAPVLVSQFRLVDQAEKLGGVVELVAT